MRDSVSVEINAIIATRDRLSIRLSMIITPRLEEMREMEKEERK